MEITAPTALPLDGVLQRRDTDNSNWDYLGSFPEAAGNLQSSQDLSPHRVLSTNIHEREVQKVEQVVM